MLSNWYEANRPERRTLHDDHVMAGACPADARQKLGLFDIGSPERVRGNRIANDLSEREEERFECHVPNGLRLRQIGIRERSERW